MLANFAMDFAINPLITDANLKVKDGRDVQPVRLPKETLVDYNPDAQTAKLAKKYTGWCWERIYEDLKQHVKYVQMQGVGQGKDGNGQGHPWNCGGVLEAPGGADGQVTQKAEWEQAVRQAAQAAKAQGKLPSTLESLVESIVEPKLDWRSLLREFIETCTDRTDYTWTRPNKAYAYYDTYLPSLYGEAAPAFAVAVDTSGSVSDQELAEFSAEIAAIASEVKPLTLTVIHCDAAVHKAESFERGEEVRITTFHGRGGTDFRPPFEYVQKEALDIAALVYLTDLQGTFPDSPPPYPVLWISTTKEQAPWGQTVRLETEPQ